MVKVKKKYYKKMENILNSNRPELEKSICALKLFFKAHHDLEEEIK